MRSSLETGRREVGQWDGADVGAALRLPLPKRKGANKVVPRPLGRAIAEGPVRPESWGVQGPTVPLSHLGRVSQSGGVAVEVVVVNMKWPPSQPLVQGGRLPFGRSPSRRSR